MIKNLRDLLIFIIWFIFVALSILYSFTYLSYISFAGTQYNEYLNWPFEYLDPECRFILNRAKDMSIYVLVYFFVGQLMRKKRNLFSIIAGLCLGAYLSRYGFLYYLFFVIFNFVISYLAHKSIYYKQMIWPIHLGILVLINIFGGFEFTWKYHDNNYQKNVPIPWQHYYCWTMLRMVSYNFDIVDDSAPKELIEYLAYILYPPLLYSGPMIPYKYFEFQQRVIKWKFIFYGLLLYILSLTSSAYAMSNHQSNKWIWNQKVTSLSGYSFLIGSMFFYFVKFTFIWCLQQCWAAFDGVIAESNEDQHIFMIYSVKGFSNNFCRTFKQMMINYVVQVYEMNKILKIIMIYSIIIIFTDSDEKTVFFWIFICLMNILENCFYFEFHWILQLIGRGIGQFIILSLIIILYSSDLEIFQEFLMHKSVYWIGIMVAQCFISAMLNTNNQ